MSHPTIRAHNDPARDPHLRTMSKCGARKKQGPDQIIYLPPIGNEGRKRKTADDFFFSFSVIPSLQYIPENYTKPTPKRVGIPANGGALITVYDSYGHRIN